MYTSNHYSPAVSVIMPAYNSAGTLKEAIDSVLNQSFKDFELIICNDASTDETKNILNNIQDDRIRVIHNSSNLGQGPSRDRAFEISRGIWGAVIDSDDAWVPNRLEVLMETANQVGEGFIFDNILECHDDALGKIHPWRAIRGKHAFGGDGSNIVNVSIENLICSDRSLLKPIFPLHYIREHAITHGTSRYGQDYAFFLRILANGKLPIWYIPKPLYLYRITPGSACANKNRYKLLKEILEQEISLFPEANIQNAFRKKIATIDRDEKYIKFIWSIKDKQFGDALKMLLRNPWFVIEFLLRAENTLAYHAHRIWHGGLTRGTY
ncbi:MAG: glycosyltransferase family 2 protein [Desulfobulbaceae bacterium]|nr:glycosyltransferase family 2 protein [Desulfobulbaceae bacterium]